MGVKRNIGENNGWKHKDGEDGGWGLCRGWFVVGNVT